MPRTLACLSWLTLLATTAGCYIPGGGWTLRGGLDWRTHRKPAAFVEMVDTKWDEWNRVAQMNLLCQEFPPDPHSPASTQPVPQPLHPPLSSPVPPPAPEWTPAPAQPPTPHREASPAPAANSSTNAPRQLPHLQEPQPLPGTLPSEEMTPASGDRPAASNARPILYGPATTRWTNPSAEIIPASGTVVSNTSHELRPPSSPSPTPRPALPAPPSRPARGQWLFSRP